MICTFCETDIPGDLSALKFHMLKQCVKFAYTKVANPEGCYCKPGRCMAPKVMGRQMPCLNPEKARMAPDAA